MRKGFTLVELLVVMVTIPILMNVFSGLFRTLIIDAPFNWKTIQQNAIVLGMLSQIQQDVDKATGLPHSYDGFNSSDDLLLIEQVDGVICYQLKEEQIVRLLLTDKQQSAQAEKRIWSIPGIKIKWLVRRIDDKGYAVEVQNHIEQTISGRTEQKMANSHLYFTGIF